MVKYKVKSMNKFNTMLTGINYSLINPEKNLDPLLQAY